MPHISAGTLSSRYLGGLDEASRAEASCHVELEAGLRYVLTAARETRPDIAVSDDEFLAYLARRVRAESLCNQKEAARLCAGDLLIACAYARRDPAAIATLEAEHMPTVAAALLKIGASPAVIADVSQGLRQRLLLGDTAEVGGITYGGRGALVRWLCVTAVRAAGRLQQRTWREIPVDDAELADRVEPAEEPELVYVKERYRDAFKAAFEEALASLERRERNVLRYRLIDGFSIDEIGVLYQVHRATVARWIAQSRERLLARTKAVLQQKMAIASADFASVARLVQSQLDVSIRRILADQSAEE